MPTRHLDLGCGPVPRNPYGRDELYGVDLGAASPADAAGDSRIRRANLALQPIPWPDSSFDSVSAYDFLEHVPRLLATADGSGTRFPFVELMNEVWRVLKPGAMFYAVTPAYPHPAVFQDPTHVNFLTRGSHDYFTRPHRLAAMYGFAGDFRCVRAQPTRHHAAAPAYDPAPQSWIDRWRHSRRVARGACGHLIWEFEALKAPAATATTPAPPGPARA
ncbi:MAG: methyltransferase domain-containing protein [Rubrivivax sp.]|nr:methyltransferase domain-containing protein [Rubrivivax sp.]